MVTQASAPTAARDEIETTLLEIFRTHLKTEGTGWDASTTMAEAQVDSFDLVELVFEIEDRFGIEVSFNANSGETSELTVGHVAEMIRASLAAKKSPTGASVSSAAAVAPMSKVQLA